MTGFISYSRQAAEEFAVMDQEKANVRKYTGMSEESVNQLNESFKQNDTRTAREELNKYAQEAGRLGKTTEAEFTSRMGVVGAQAGMSVQQIMAFGALLDANINNYEAAFTEPQQLIVCVYLKPAQYA